MIRIGIVGCGRILAAHLRGYRLLREAGIDDFRISALCARRETDAAMYLSRGAGPPQRPAVSSIAGDPLSIGDEYLSDFQNDVEVPLYSDYRHMIAEAPIDAVNDFTSHDVHHQVADAALKAGKHLLTQKPLAVSMAAGRSMCQLAESRDLVFGVFENFRFTPATRQLRWLFESGHCGRLQMVLHGYVGVWWAPDRVVANTPWRHRRAAGGGISLDLGVHFFNQLRHVAGEIESVTANVAVLEPKRRRYDAGGAVVEEIDCDADDTTFANAVTKSGVHAELCASWAGHAGPTRLGQGSVFYGSRGRVEGEQVELDDGQRHRLADWYNEHAAAVIQQHDFPLGLNDSFALAQHDWLEAIRHRRPPETDGWEGLRDLAAAFAILESSHAGRRVAVQDVFDLHVREYQRPIDEQFGLV